MRSTTGEHYVALDHIRALAALLVFAWHFLHGHQGSPVPFADAPIWSPLVFFDEGHVGVALFMTLSGYLFAKLLDGKNVSYPHFLWNRLLRLMPLLVFVMLINSMLAAYENHNLSAAYAYLLDMGQGLIYPTWPNGGWSITVEWHFYLILPLLLMISRHSRQGLWLILIGALLVRFAYHERFGEVQSMAYLTLMGRIDQFLLGIMAFQHRSSIIGRNKLAILIALGFTTLYWWFDQSGGFFRQPSYPSPSRIWIILPTLEGLALAFFIAWYDGFNLSNRRPWSRFLGVIGEYSYSIYLLHFYFVFYLANWIHAHLLNLSHFYLALPVAILMFFSMLPISYLSMRFLERPFLNLRTSYVKTTSQDNLSAPAC